MDGLTAIGPVSADAWDMHDVGAGWWVAMMLGMVVFWALVIVGVVWLVRGGTRDSSRNAAESASELLDQRLALGEISVEEYEQRRRALQSESGSG